MRPLLKVHTRHAVYCACCPSLPRLSTRLVVDSSNRKIKTCQNDLTGFQVPCGNIRFDSLVGLGLPRTARTEPRHDFLGDVAGPRAVRLPSRAGARQGTSRHQEAPGFLAGRLQGTGNWRNTGQAREPGIRFGPFQANSDWFWHPRHRDKKRSRRDCGWEVPGRERDRIPSSNRGTGRLPMLLRRVSVPPSPVIPEILA